MSSPPPNPATAPPTIIVIRDRPGYWGDYESWGSGKTASSIVFWVLMGVSFFLLFSLLFSSCYWRDEPRERCDDDVDERSVYVKRSRQRAARRQYGGDGDVAYIQTFEV